MNQSGHSMGSGYGQVPPWHMWGSNVRMQLTPVAGGNVQASQQLLRINYKRPETWSFWFGCTVRGGLTVDIVTVRVAVDLTLGIGRDMYRTENDLLSTTNQFIQFFYNFPAATNLGVPQKKWTTVGNPVTVVDGDATTLTRPEWIAAQDIQVGCRVFVVAETTEAPLDIEVYGGMAPRTHVRPDWYSEEQQFLGGEAGGS